MAEVKTKKPNIKPKKKVITDKDISVIHTLDGKEQIELVAAGEISLLPQLAASRPARRADEKPLDMDVIIESVARSIATTQDQYKCIMFTDLVGSTEYKRRMGHTKGFMRNRVFCDTCERGVERFDGMVVKRLGDGVMAVFESAMDAVLTALMIRRTIEANRRKLKKLIGPVQYRIGITCGYVKEIDGDAPDYIGHAMDKGARIESVAKDNQVLIDEIVYGLIHTKIRDYSEDIIIGPPRNLTLKGIGVSTLYEIAPKEMGLAGSIGSRLRQIFR
ncbi:MAG: adenylate/guanylate cyclase domain-containing protein [Mariprofundaceae bacterium]|nr:adenylate/guanylate cyclase domain-containing protein [Mariprofundaceae bacterium]